MFSFKKISALLKRFKTTKDFPVKPILRSSASENSIAVWMSFSNDEVRGVEELHIMQEFGQREKSIIPIVGLFLDKCTEYNDRFKVVFLVHQNFGVIKSAIDWYCADQADLQLRRRPAWIQGLVLHQPHRQV